MILKKRILIVDDSRILREIVKRHLLSNFDVDIFQAQNGEDAEMLLQDQLSKNEPIDLMFLDWIMPKMTGFDLLKSLRSTDVFRDIPKIIMLTAETYPEQMQACSKYNISGYLTKPFSQEQLVKVMKDTLNIEALKNAV